MHRFGALRLRGMPRRDRHILLGLTLLSVALAVLQSVTGLSADVLLAVPAALLLLPLLAGRYVGERALAPLVGRVRRTVAAALHRAPPRARLVPRGGLLVGCSLAGRAPPVV
jgi:hypothetical protein